MSPIELTKERGVVLFEPLFEPLIKLFDKLGVVLLK